MSRFKRFMSALAAIMLIMSAFNRSAEAAQPAPQVCVTTVLRTICTQPGIEKEPVPDETEVTVKVILYENNTFRYVKVNWHDWATRISASPVGFSGDKKSEILWGDEQAEKPLSPDTYSVTFLIDPDESGQRNIGISWGPDGGGTHFQMVIKPKLTPTPTATSTLTKTAIPTQTPTPTLTSTPTNVVSLTVTPTGIVPTATPMETKPAETNTPTPTGTPQPTNSPTATRPPKTATSIPKPPDEAKPKPKLEGDARCIPVQNSRGIGHFFVVNNGDSMTIPWYWRVLLGEEDRLLEHGRDLLLGRGKSWSPEYRFDDHSEVSRIALEVWKMNENGDITGSKPVLRLEVRPCPSGGPGREQPPSSPPAEETATPTPTSTAISPTATPTATPTKTPPVVVTPPPSLPRAGAGGGDLVVLKVFQFLRQQLNWRLVFVGMALFLPTLIVVWMKRILV